MLELSCLHWRTSFLGFSLFGANRIGPHDFHVQSILSSAAESADGLDKWRWGLPTGQILFRFWNKHLNANSVVQDGVLSSLNLHIFCRSALDSQGKPGPRKARLLARHVGRRLLQPRAAQAARARSASTFSRSSQVRSPPDIGSDARVDGHLLRLRCGGNRRSAIRRRGASLRCRGLRRGPGRQARQCVKIWRAARLPPPDRLSFSYQG